MPGGPYSESAADEDAGSQWPSPIRASSLAGPGLMKRPEHGSGGGQPGIDPQLGEGTGGGPTWESLGTEGPHLFLLSYIGRPQGDMAPSWPAFPRLTSQHHYTHSFSCVLNCSPS